MEAVVAFGLGFDLVVLPLRMGADPLAVPANSSLEVVLQSGLAQDPCLAYAAEGP